MRWYDVTPNLESCRFRGTPSGAGRRPHPALAASVTHAIVRPRVFRMPPTWGDLRGGQQGGRPTGQRESRCRRQRTAHLRSDGVEPPAVVTDPCTVRRLFRKPDALAVHVRRIRIPTPHRRCTGTPRAATSADARSGCGHQLSATRCLAKARDGIVLGVYAIASRVPASSEAARRRFTAHRATLGRTQRALVAPSGSAVRIENCG